MSGKLHLKTTTYSAGSVIKKQRKAIDLEIKMKIMKIMREVQVIANSYGFSRSTSSTMVKDKTK